jgi:hypothetical protein
LIPWRQILASSDCMLAKSSDVMPVKHDYVLERNRGSRMQKIHRFVSQKSSVTALLRAKLRPSLPVERFARFHSHSCRVTFLGEKTEKADKVSSTDRI